MFEGLVFELANDFGADCLHLLAGVLDCLEAFKDFPFESLFVLVNSLVLSFPI